MPSRSGDIQSVLLELLLGTVAREKVTQPVKGGPEDLTTIGSSDTGQFWQCEESSRAIEAR